jgi:hypothetical protein
MIERVDYSTDEEYEQALIDELLAEEDYLGMEGVREVKRDRDICSD